MEQSRVFLAITLSLVVFFIWGALFAPKPEKQAPKEMPTQTQKEPLDTNKTTNVAEKRPNVAETRPSEPAPSPKPAILSRPAKTITIRTPLYTTKISEQGAVVKSFITNKYKETTANDSPPKELVIDNSQGTLQFGFSKMPVSESENAHYVADTELESIDIIQSSQDLRFTWITSQGLRVTKKFTFDPNSYVMGLSITMSNDTTSPFVDEMYLALTNKVKGKKRTYGFTGSSALLDQKLQQIKPKDIEDTTYRGNFSWIAYQDRYFMASIIPKDPITATMKIAKNDQSIVQTKLIMPPLSISPGKEKTFQYQVFMGPKSIDLLKKVGHNLDLSINFGWFSFLAKPCLWLMKYIYNNLIPNYGVAIILLTLLIKITLWPLGTKSYKSMNEMKKLQPLMTEIREKYKDDKKKMNEEIMGLYKTYKINPMGGCLPMVAQIPIFFAFYRMLYDAFELRHAPFFGWINDLSAPDRLMHFNFSIPFMQPPYGIPVLTIIMGASMLVQQKISPPTGGDPTQAKMMMMMPIIFTFIFINFSSGLVLYWLVNNILSIGQQYYISKKYA